MSSRKKKKKKFNSFLTPRAFLDTLTPRSQTIRSLVFSNNYKCTSSMSIHQTVTPLLARVSRNKNGSTNSLFAFFTLSLSLNLFTSPHCLPVKHRHKLTHFAKLTTRNETGVLTLEKDRSTPLNLCFESFVHICLLTLPNYLQVTLYLQSTSHSAVFTSLSTAAFSIASSQVAPHLNVYTCSTNVSFIAPSCNFTII